MPTIHSWELDDFYRQVRKSVLELEDAFACHELDLRLQHRDFRNFGGTAVAAAYRRLRIDAPERCAALRLDAIRALLEHLRQELFSVESVARAELALSEKGKPVVRVPHDGVLLDLRFDQFLSARAWGRGLEFDDVQSDQAFAELVAHNACTRLAFDLRSLQRVFRRFTPRDVTDPLRVVPRPAERAFERLMVDILNEHAETVWQARIDEDFLEKVDLRIAARDPAVVEGVGIQVTQVSAPELYASKLGKIKHVDRFVILSPTALAEFVDAQMAPGSVPRVLSDAMLKSLWTSLGDQPGTVSALTLGLKSLLVRALRIPTTDPRGPMLHVPEAVRRLIRTYVNADAKRASAALALAPRPDVPEQVLRARHTIAIPKSLAALCSHRQAVAAIGQFVAGQSTVGRVRRTVDYGVFVSLGGVDGLLHISAIPAAEGSLAQRFPAGAQITVTVASVDVATARLQLTQLPLDEPPPRLPPQLTRCFES